MIRYAEFCAGIGGFRLGIESSALNAELVYTNEIDDKCECTYSANFDEHFSSKNLFDIDCTKLPNFDLLCAGFPCQPFSLAGLQRGFSDPRGTIFFKLLEIIKIKRPGILFFENVPNLSRHNNGETYKFIKDSLSELGYQIYDAIIDSTFFNVPQSRPRIYIVCFDKSKYDGINFQFTKRRSGRTPLRGYLKEGDYSIPISNKWQEYIDLYTNKKTAAEISFPLPKTRRKLERIASNCDLKDCIFQIRSSGIRAYSLDDSFPTFAVSNSGGGPMIPVLSKERRHLNLTEMRRIMGFPDNYDLSKVSRTDAVKELANAVCPPVIKSICNDLNECIA